VRSNEIFVDAFQDIEGFDSRALISVRDSSAFLGTLLINEKAAPYRGEPFERIYVHTLSALNYLLLGDKGAARVEIRRAYNRQTQERLAHQEEYNEALRKSRAYGVYYPSALNTVRCAYEDGRTLARVNVFQDAFSYYVSSLVYEMLGEYNEALIDAKKMLVLRPGSRLAREQVARCVQQAPQLGDGTTRAYADVQLPQSGQGQVVVLMACGLAPVKIERSIQLPVPTGRGLTYNKVAFPAYHTRDNPVAMARVSVAGRVFGVTEVLSDVERKARANLWQRLPTLVMKSLLRAAVRYGAQKALLDSGHQRDRPLRQAAAMGLGLVGAAVEQADLRSWLTLPRSFQAVRGIAPAGRHGMTVELVDRNGRPQKAILEPVEIREGRITVVFLRIIGTRMVIHSRSL